MSLDLQSIEQTDGSRMRESILKLQEQLRLSWQAASQIQIPAEYGQAKSIVVAGMGGSGLGSHFIQTTYGDRLKVPFEISHEYTVPAYVNAETLVLLSSYSGTTEETLAAAEDALSKGAKLLGICAGGTLAEWCEEQEVPCYVFDPSTANPSNQPRMGGGYSIGGQLRLLSSAKLLQVSDADIETACAAIEAIHQTASFTQLDPQTNPALNLALRLHHKIFSVCSSQPLSGAAHYFANQSNENAKVFADFHLVPELNHHILEMTRFPDKVGNLVPVIILSHVDHPKVQQRQQVLRQLCDSSTFPYVAVELKGKTLAEQAYELLTLGSWTSFYLAMLEGLDPSPIPTVDSFKASMKA